MLKRFILISLLLIGNIFAYYSKEEIAIEYRIDSWKDTLFIGEPLVLTNILINKSTDTLKICDRDALWVGENPIITISNPNGKEDVAQKSSVLRVQSRKYITIPPNDTLIIDLSYPQIQVKNSVFRSFLNQPGDYKIKGFFHHFWFSSQKIEPNDSESLWKRGVTSNQLLLTVLIPPKGEREAAKDFIYSNRNAEEFIKKYPNSIYTPYVLYGNLTVLFSKLKYEESFNIITQLTTDYPHFIYTKYCNIFKGNYYFNMGNIILADKYYRLFIAEYPKSYKAAELLEKHKELQ